ncbi:MAG TPA: 2-dehydropantoate 2-reductase [Kofleriaceae bacterium]|jgi:2-dehydropantoate 2-reductase|nr:2-dehydropantoate 2-reductase [Kofleriaceae bacterium]
MRFAVYGVGGAGGYFGARLAEAGYDVTFIARGDHLAAIQKSGLRIDSVHGDFVVNPARASGDPSEVGAVDYVILGVKAWQVPDAARAIAPLMGPATAVLPVQNGVEAADQIAEALGRAHALGGTARIISFRAGPGHLKHAGAEPLLEIGELDGTRSARVEALRQAFTKAKGITITFPPDIRVAMWSKFVFIASWSGVGSATRVPLQLVRGVPETRRLLENAMREIEQVGKANAVQLPEDVVATSMAYIDSLPPQATPSMQRDIAEGKPSEIENLTGAVSRLGARTGVATPINTFLYQVLLPLEQLARGQLQRVAGRDPAAPRDPALNQ